MTYAYDESYLSDVQKNLGFFFQFTLCTLQLSPKETQDAFLHSEIPAQIEQGNPNFLCGKSGFELATIVFTGREIFSQILMAQQEPFYPQAEYWCGYVLAYCHWKNNISFDTLLHHFSLAQLLDSYTLLHEADISKAEQIIMEHVPVY